MPLSPFLAALKALSLLLFAAPVAAAPLPVRATLSVTLFGETLTASGTGIAEVAPDGSIALPAGLVPLSGVFPVTFPPPVVQVSVSGALAAGTFAPSAGPGGGFGAFFFPVAAEAKLGLFDIPPLVTLILPLHILGNGGTFEFFNPMQLLSTLTGVWTTGTVTRMLPTTGGGNKKVVLRGFDAPTTGGARRVQLVTPVTIFGNVGEPPALVIHATLRLRIPEPPGPLLLGTAGAALWLAARRRSSRPA